ncbi:MULTISPECIES: EAL domain-containing protein [Marinobacter]|uniref:EAL domain-containing protein n=1 Tax=Marinobacter TaxID=2742 RepID=UPI001109DC68|nr:MULTISPECIES: EAL domain-containing protein [Marinobacter]
MKAQDFVVAPKERKVLSLGGQGATSVNISKFLVVCGLLGLSAFIVYTTGGTKYAYPYVIFLPIVLTAAWFGSIPAIVSALVAGVLLGPLMPLDAKAGVMQSTDNWLIRIGFFCLIAFFTSWLFQALRNSTLRLLREVQLDKDTGLPNKAALNEDLRRVLSFARSQKTSKASPAVILIRMQDLWEVIDAMGSEAAEKVVKSVADNIRSAFRAEHRIYRFSNSELLLLFFAESREDVDSAAGLVSRVGEKESEVDGLPLRVQLVAGSYLVDQHDLAPELVINRARTGLVAAIETSQFYKAYDPVLDRQTAGRVQLISRVRDGLAKNQFTLFYQPKICLKTGEHIGSEGLLRWFDDDGKMVLPGVFMPKLESTTLIEPVTRFVIRKACEDIEQFNLSAVSINFSTKNLRDDALIQNLGEIVSLYGVEPGKLEIEITEGALISDPAHAKLSIERLREQGFLVSLDDFGTGYSSFQYLSQLPLSGLKIDRAFVMELENSARARTVLSSMVKMAHALDLTVTIEGVETAEQYDIVTELGADVVQGFYFAKPLSCKDYQAWVCDRKVDSLN